MSFALAGHHILLIATLLFVTAVLTPNWYTDSDNSIDLNVFKVCYNTSLCSSCPWIFSLPSSHLLDRKVRPTYPIVTGSFAITCVVLSLFALLLCSWYIHQCATDNDSRRLLISIILLILFSFLLSCGVWIIMLTTNMQQQFPTFEIRLDQIGFSFWINIVSSGGYLVVLVIYLIDFCRDW